MSSFSTVYRNAAKTQRDSKRKSDSPLFNLIKEAAHSEARSMGLDPEIYHDFKFQTQSVDSAITARREAREAA